MDPSRPPSRGGLMTPARGGFGEEEYRCGSTAKYKVVNCPVVLLYPFLHGGGSLWLIVSVLQRWLLTGRLRYKRSL